MATTARKPLLVPARGVIKGGRLDGWRFMFLQFRVDPDSQALYVLARCSAPRWPFPCDIPLDHTHFRQLRAVVGERAKRLPARTLIDYAYRLHEMEPPAALGRRSTVWGKVKAASSRSRA